MRPTPANNLAVLAGIQPAELRLRLGLQFLRPAQFLAELVHPNERNQLRPSIPRATVWIILQTSPFKCVACYLFRMAFTLTEIYFNVGFLGTLDMTTLLIFSLSWKTV